MTTINAKDFETRAELEAYVRNKVDLTPTLKDDFEIVGTEAELAALHLSSTTLVLGHPLRAD